jgi:hydroxymethylpyrimidine pyrophosphatase-like HAD family hydrolase
MRYVALATDYDGTLATDGHVADSTNSALERLKEAGRKLILVTGRHLPDLKLVYSRLELFDRVVAENGAVLYDPRTQHETLLADPPPRALLDLLEKKGIPFAAGRGIIATWKPHEQAILDAIRDLGLEQQIILNQSSVMVLPSGINKATGLKVALGELGIQAQDVIAVGDAENDHSLLSACGCGVAVANALPALKERAQLITKHDHGAGVEELIEQLLADDLANSDITKQEMGGSPLRSEAHS